MLFLSCIYNLSILGIKASFQGIVEYEMVCAIWYHLQNLKNVKNTHGGD